MNLTDYFYTQSQTAKVLDVKPITIWRWIKNGKFNIQRIGGIVLIPKWEVELLKDTKKDRKIY